VSSEALVSGAVTASAARRASGLSGRVAINLDGSEVGLEIVDGRVVGAVPPAEAAVAVPLSGAQLAAILDGSVSMAQAFMKGDLKPEGATGPLLALIELFEDDEFRKRLADTTAQ
jgi:putative sterol carrier protein